MEGQAVFSDEVLARYAADAAREVSGVSLSGSTVHRGKAVVASVAEEGIRLGVHVEIEWGASAGEVGSALQSQVREYVERMTNARVDAVDVVVERIGSAPAP